MMLWSHLQLMTYPVKLEIKASVSTPQLASFLNLSPDYLCIFALLHFLGIETPSPFMDLPSPGAMFQTAPGRIVENAVPREEKVLSIRFVVG